MLFVFTRSFYLLFLFLFILSSILLLPLRIRISIDNLRENNSVSSQLEIFILGRIKAARLRKELLVDKNTDKLLAGIDRWKALWKKPGEIRLRQILNLANRFIHTVRWKAVDVKAKVGAADAAWTGVLTGFLRQLAAIVSNYFFQALSLEKRPRLLIYPSYGQKEFVFSIVVEFYTNGFITLYYSILIMWEAVFRVKIQLLWRAIRYGRASHTGFDDNRHGKFKGNGRCY